MTQTLTRQIEAPSPISIRLAPAITMTEEQFAEFCTQNDNVRIERTAEGILELMPPTWGRTGHQNADITADLKNWSRRDGTGVSFDSNTGFRLPNGAMRSPDASWIPKSRLAALPEEDKSGFLPLCPDFVVELRSSSDRLSTLQAKMEEYRANGARLGWLLDPTDRTAHVYRPQQQPEILHSPSSLSAAPELSGFTLDLTPIWQPAF